MAEVAANAAVLLGHLREEQAGLAGCGPKRVVDDPRSFPFVKMRLYLRSRKAANAFAQERVLLVEYWAILQHMCRAVRWKLEGDLVAALELEKFPRLVRTGDLKPKPFDDLADLRHLFGIGFCEAAGADPQTVFEPDPDVAAHRGSHRGDRHLGAAGAEDRPVVAITEQTIGRPLHVHNIVRMRTDAAEKPEARLDE